ncbi:CidA/LrgA family protein [Sutcliffiella rhizosphaerae]|uniref:CidA/LrgA family protein n=1 Tax=Sutcliffiella rhizosphaerae TaxID=2880967 RepID=A0ABN8AG53_9BACI|nr:CidA/LrgA family protein [Sutcliffiella rhizosphaerae]CAG9622143.1 hypothetical protein BACCIP111883_02934 [Sutcliffiella rhizosphaerae]
MWGIKVIVQISIIYLFYLIGMVLQDMSGIPIPGSIIGMLLLFLLLLTGIIKENFLKAGAERLLLYLPLFFVPATVGVMGHFGFLFSKPGMVMLLALSVGTFLVLLSSSWVAQKATDVVDNKTKALGGKAR